MAVLFISEDKLKRSTTINGNVDVELLRPYMKVAQDLYQKLQTEITNGTLTGNYETLINDYIQDALVHWTLYEAMPFLGYKIMNNDIVRQTSETSQTAPLEEINFLRNTVMNTAEWYTERLIDEYNTNTGADLRPSRQNYNNGMNLDHVYPDKNKIRLSDFLDGSI